MSRSMNEVTGRLIGHIETGTHLFLHRTSTVHVVNLVHVENSQIPRLSDTKPGDQPLTGNNVLLQLINPRIKIHIPHSDNVPTGCDRKEDRTGLDWARYDDGVQVRLAPYT